MHKGGSYRNHNSSVRQNSNSQMTDHFYDGQNSMNVSQCDASNQNSNPYQVLHEAIIDLYLQVKVRSNDEIDRFGQD